MVKRVPLLPNNNRNDMMMTTTTTTNRRCIAAHRTALGIYTSPALVGGLGRCVVWNRSMVSFYRTENYHDQKIMGFWDFGLCPSDLAPQQHALLLRVASCVLPLVHVPLRA
jgi:hypothetical protein